MVDAGSTPEWWDSAKLAISTSDTLLKDIIEEFEEPKLSSRGDLFATLVKSIVGQQISVIAASAIWSRFEDCVGEVTPESILAKGHQELKEVGLSNRKVEYILGIAQAWIDGFGEIDWDLMSDEEVIEELSKITWSGALDGTNAANFRPVASGCFFQLMILA